jgi:hypothetical protein
LQENNEFIKSKSNEEAHRENDTGFRTEDILKIIEIDKENRWSIPMTAQEIISHMESLGIKNNANPTA